MTNYELKNPNQDDERYNRSNIRVEIHDYKKKKKTSKVAYYITATGLMLLFIFSIILYKELAMHNKYQEWYYILLQWILIFISGTIYFGSRKSE